jgi:hypothetical protein
MELIVNRQFKTGSGPWPWKLRIQLRVAEDERSILEHYGLGDHMLRRSQVSIVTLQDALTGTSVSAPSLDMMMQMEQELREAVAAIPVMLDYLGSFDSELVSEMGGVRL